MSNKKRWSLVTKLPIITLKNVKSHLTTTQDHNRISISTVLRCNNTSIYHLPYRKTQQNPQLIYLLISLKILAFLLNSIKTDSFLNSLTPKGSPFDK